jgi:hypothetical protein
MPSPSLTGRDDEDRSLRELSVPTPGPWCIASDPFTGQIGIGSTTGVVVFAPYIAGPDQPGVQGLANARLIAAAPDMYEALKLARGLLKEEGWHTGPVGRAIDAALSQATAKQER